MKSVMTAALLGVAIIMTQQSALSQIIVGHRGASYDAPENTLCAFRLAWEQQADGIEADFHLTSDSQIVCIHDADTKRTTGTKLIVAKSTLAELQALEYGSWKDEKFRGEPIPTFDDVLSVVPPNRTFVIELKTGPEIVPLLKKQLDQATSPLPQLLIISFNEDTVVACRQLLPDVRVHWLTGYKQDKVTRQWTPNLDAVASSLRKTNATGLGTQGNRELLNEKFISTLRANGLREFHVWTVDDPEDAVFFLSLGAIGITTNRPQLIRNALTKESSQAD